ncbi:MAG: hypothetical protein ACTHK1_00320 [Actinomycetales bacterium]
MPAPVAPAPVSWDAAWESALDELELDLDTAEALLVRAEPAADRLLALSAWQPPVLEGPLPDRLVPRARRLLQRQLDAAHSLAAATSKARREMELLGKLDEPAGRVPAVYFDSAF